MLADIASTMLDLANNSVRAKATSLRIRLVEEEDKNRFLLWIKDNGQGMDRKLLEKVQSPFFTTRTTRKIGLGIPFAKELAQLCEGRFCLKSKPGQGTLIAIEMKADHWDRPPLGDVGEALSTLIQSASEVEIRFSAKKNQKRFTLNTTKLKELLDGVRLDSPDVILWIKDYVRQELTKIEMR